MAYGLRIKNSVTGGLQIDDRYSNLALSTKGAVATDANQSVASGKQSSYKTIALPASASKPVIALYSTAAPVVVIDQTPTAFTVFAQGNFPQAFEYFVFDEAEVCPTPAAGYGLLVRDKTTGDVRFDSRMRYMNVKGQGDFPATLLGPTPTALTILAAVSGRKFAGLQCSGAVRQITDGGSGGAGAVPATQYAAGVKVTSGTLQAVSFAVFGFGSSTGFDSGGTDGRWLAIDVTGF